MNAIEILSRALDKLEAEKDASDDNATAPEWVYVASAAGTVDIGSRYPEWNGEPEVIAKDLYEPDAALILTTHRLVTPVLDILNREWSVLADEPDVSHPITGGLRYALELAKAILGEK